MEIEFKIDKYNDGKSEIILKQLTHKQFDDLRILLKTVLSFNINDDLTKLDEQLSVNKIVEQLKK